MEFKGITRFDEPPAPSYRYVITLKNDKMNIVLQNMTTKRRWHAYDLDQGAYVTSGNSLPRASILDYAKCFRDSLKGNLDNGGDSQRKLVKLRSGAVRLELKITVRALEANWVPEYLFKLNPRCKRTQFVEMKGLKEEQKEEGVKRPRKNLGDVSEPLCLQLEAPEKVNRGLSLRWVKAQSPALCVAGDDGVVKILLSGLYHLEGVVNCTPTRFNHNVQVLNNGKSIMLCYCGGAGNKSVSTRVYCTASLQKGDELAVTCDANIANTSFLSITKQ